MPHTNTSLQNVAHRDAHRMAQKVSLLVMASWLLACHWAQEVVAVAMPDTVMLTIIVGLLTYVMANHVARLRFTANNYSEDEWLHMFVMVDTQ
jgi:hypothetical protein